MASAPTTSTAAGPYGSAPAASGSTTSAPTISTSGTTASTCISSASNTTFGMPSGISLPVFNGTEYSTWAGILEAILALHEADNVIFHDTVPTGGDAGDFAMISRRAKAYLRLFIKPDVDTPQAPLGGENMYFAVFKQFWYILVLQLQARPSHSPGHSLNASAPPPLRSGFPRCSGFPAHTPDHITGPIPSSKRTVRPWLLCIPGLPLVPRLVTTLISIYISCNYNLSTREEVPTFPLTVLTSELSVAHPRVLESSARVRGLCTVYPTLSQLRRPTLASNTFRRNVHGHFRPPVTTFPHFRSYTFRMYPRP